MEPSVLRRIERDILNLSGAVREGLDVLDGKIDGLRKGVGELNLLVSDLTGRVTRVEVVVEELKEEILAIGEAVSKDAETIIRHDVRIGRLEKTIYTA